MTNREYAYQNDENTRKARAFLTRPSSLDKAITMKLEEISHLRELVSQMTAYNTDARVVVSRNVTALEDRLLTICQLEREVDRLIDEMSEAREAVERTLDRLPLPIHRVLELIYLSGFPRAEVARKMNTSRTTVYRYQEQGILLVAGLLGPEEAA